MNSTISGPEFDRQRVALIDCSERHQLSLEKSLQRLGIRWFVVRDDMPAPLDDCCAAIVELDVLNSPNAVKQLRSRAVPLCALTRQETLSQIQRGVALGATAILHQPITQGTVYTALMMAFALGEQIDALHTRNAALTKRLDGYPLVAQAIACLIVQLNLSEEEAYERLRSRAMGAHRSMVEVSQDILRHGVAARRSSS